MGLLYLLLFIDAKAEVIPAPKDHAMNTSALDLGGIPAPPSLAGCLFIGVGGPRTGLEVSR